MDAQTMVLEITRQNHGTDHTTGKFFVTGKCGITGRTVYLQTDGTLKKTCVNGWFSTIGEVGAALCKFHTEPMA